MGDNQLIVTDEEIKKFGEKIKLKSNGGIYHIEDVNVNVNANVNDKLVESGIGFGFGSSERRLRKWKRIPRELVVKKPSSKLDDRQNGDFALVNGGSGTSEDDLSSRSSNGGGDMKRNGRDEPGKKARGFGVEKEKVSGSVGSDSRSVNFVFVQGGNTVGSGGGRESGVFGKYDEECSDAANYGGDRDLNEDVRVEFVKSDGEFDDDVLQEDLAAENDKIDPLVESIKELSFAHDEFEKEVQNWRDIGKNDPLICEDPMHELLEFQDAKISELESVLTSEDTKTVLEDTLQKIIQAEVEYVAIKTTTESLTAEVKHILHQKTVSSQNMDTAEDVKKQQNGENLPLQNTQVLKKQAEKLVTREDVKKLQKRVSRFTSCFFIQLILLLVILFLKFSPQNVEIVPT